MTTRRSSRRVSRNTSRSIPPSVERGLRSLIDKNESYVSQLLSLRGSPSTSSENSILEALQECMGMNDLSAEMLLARFFDVQVLKRYAEEVLEKSGKGSAPTLAARIFREWSREDFGTPSRGKRKRREETDESDENGTDDDDWRRPLFYWKGRLGYDAEKGTVNWSGSWVAGAAERGVPPPDEFEASRKKNSFQLSNAGKLIHRAESGSAGVRTARSLDSQLLSSLNGLSGHFNGSYLLDQDDGKGPARHKDVSHFFSFFDAAPENDSSGNDGLEIVLAAAYGVTEFGNFVSFGYVQEVGGIMEFVLARRYIRDDDSRQDFLKKKEVQGLLPMHSETLNIESDAFWTSVLPRCCKR
eukprot:CAMPEP_0194310618 /NCGR_PEP_ID=MMETSP0171-20130528/7572_1 /TAXON_ID=218684 /ORGANISM="Corethron pennatum, Strain L29A3" /LENGTH=355 /DNA_ID=CAMNT_0039064337 /DNA_START=192 /DNA_END=1256 /DNA_ORIENTATION=-